MCFPDLNRPITKSCDLSCFRFPDHIQNTVEYYFFCLLINITYSTKYSTFKKVIIA